MSKPLCGNAGICPWRCCRATTNTPTRRTCLRWAPASWSLRLHGRSPQVLLLMRSCPACTCDECKSVPVERLLSLGTFSGL